MSRIFLFIACISGAIAVIMGAFGAHALTSVLSEAQLQSYKTGVQYQFYHTFAILFTAILGRYLSHRMIKICGWLFISGIICFSGSIYLLSLKDVLGIDVLQPVLGPVTPIGGLLFIAGWICLFVASKGYVKKSRPST